MSDTSKGAVSERHGLLVGPDSNGWNIHREPGHEYVESWFYRDDAVRRARALAHGNPIYVLDKESRTYFVDAAPIAPRQPAVPDTRKEPS